jgi:hypothetical protein
VGAHVPSARNAAVESKAVRYVFNLREKNRSHTAIERVKDAFSLSCDAPTDHIARGLMKAKRPFSAHVSFAPNSGVRADIPGPPLSAHRAHADPLHNFFPDFRYPIE